MSPRFTRDAAEQVAVIVEESAVRFGLEAARRYALLIQVAADAIGSDPQLAGSAPISGASGYRAYHIRLSRLRVAAADRVRSPRHLLVYRPMGGSVLVVGLVHERMLFRRAIARILSHREE